MHVCVCVCMCMYRFMCVNVDVCVICAIYMDRRNSCIAYMHEQYSVYTLYTHVASRVNCRAPNVNINIVPSQHLHISAASPLLDHAGGSCPGTMLSNLTQACHFSTFRGLYLPGHRGTPHWRATRSLRTGSSPPCPGAKLPEYVEP